MQLDSGILAFTQSSRTDPVEDGMLFGVCQIVRDALRNTLPVWHSCAMPQIRDFIARKDQMRLITQSADSNKVSSFCLDIMQPKNLTTILLLPLLLAFALLGCADKPTAPDTLTAEEIALLVETAVADELAKMENAKADFLSPQEIAEIALRSTVYLSVKTQESKPITDQAL